MKYFSLISLVLILFSCQEEQKERVLPVLGNCDVVYEATDGFEVGDTMCPTIPPFQYLNQDSVMVSSESMKGKIWISDFFFTTCPTICPKMTTQMKRLAAMIKDLEDEVQIMSFSINPTKDTPSQMRAYRKKHGIENVPNWQFFTGNEAETHALGIDYFMVHANADENAAGGYAHSDAFTLIDKEGYVRGVYIGTQTEQVNLLEKDLRKLLKYEYGVE